MLECFSYENKSIEFAVVYQDHLSNSSFDLLEALDVDVFGRIYEIVKQLYLIHSQCTVLTSDQFLIL